LRISESVTENGEQGASAIRVIARGLASWCSADQPLAVRQDRLLVLHHVVGRQAALALAAAHRSARRMEADAQLARGLDLDVDQPLLALGE
jgi:hypothetical protein